MAGQIPVVVIGGYLGAGKTTVLNRLLAQAHGIKLAVLVNDFGSVNIDAALVARRDGETISLTNGCVCCTIGDNLGLALYDLAERPDGPERIVIEASGVADPANIAHYAASHPRLALDSIVVIADAETIQERSHDKYVGDLVRLQLAAADMIVLSKTDLVDADACRRVRRWIEAELPQARILAGPDAGSFADLLLQHDDFCFGRRPGSRSEAVHEPGRRRDSRESHRALLDRAERRPPFPASDGDHGRMFTTWTFVRGCPLEGAALRAAVAALPPAVVRAKGIVRLSEAPDRRFVLQLVGRRWSLEGIPGPRTLSDRSEIVCIGPADQLDPASLEVLFADVAPAVVAPAIRGLLQGENRR